MDKTQALKKIPPDLHAAACELESCGWDWGAIVALLFQIAPVVQEWWETNGPKMKTKTTKSKSVACPEDLKEQLIAARDSAAETLCACCCACHAADCE